jgi:hypothetical protein
LSQWRHQLNLYRTQSLQGTQPLYQQNPPRSPSVSDDYTGPEHLLVPGTLRGYRAWIVGGGKLRSIIDREPWLVSGNTAMCRRGIMPRITSLHDAPDSRCTCGFYAKHRLEGVERDYDPSIFTYGSIRASGKVILGTEGFRAQHADIEALYVPWTPSPPSPDLLWHLQRINLPVFYNRDRFLAAFPPISVDHLLPPEPTIPSPPSFMAAMLSNEQIAELWKTFRNGPLIEKEQS